MVNEEILGGLKIAVSHKSSLKNAMQSFYNAGYSKEEVEEAAKMINIEQIPKSQEQVKSAEPKVIQKTTKDLKQKLDIKKPTEVKPAIVSQTPAKPSPKISTDNMKQSKRKMQIILLAGGLVFLLVMLIILFIFRDKIF